MRPFANGCIASVLTLASCGSSDSGGTSDTTGTTITKADFVEQANARCTTLSKNVAAAQANMTASPTEAEISTFMTDVLVVEFSAAISDIRELGFPAGDEDLLDGIFTDAEKVLDDISADPIGILASAESPFADVNVGFSDYGLTVCAEA